VPPNLPPAGSEEKCGIRLPEGHALSEEALKKSVIGELRNFDPASLDPEKYLQARSELDQDNRRNKHE